jgi:hypothetical protein
VQSGGNFLAGLQSFGARYFYWSIHAHLYASPLSLSLIGGNGTNAHEWRAAGLTRDVFGMHEQSPPTTEKVGSYLYATLLDYHVFTIYFAQAYPAKTECPDHAKRRRCYTSSSFVSSEALNPIRLGGFAGSALLTAINRKLICEMCWMSSTGAPASVVPKKRIRLGLK